MSDAKRLSSPGGGDALERALLESAAIPEPTAAAREAIWASLTARIAAAPPSAHRVEGGLRGVTAMAGKVGLSGLAKLALVSVTCIVVGGAVMGARVLRPTGARTAPWVSASGPASSAGALGGGLHGDGIPWDRAVLEANGATRLGEGPSLAFAEPGVPASSLASDPSTAVRSRGDLAEAAPLGAAPFRLAPSSGPAGPSAASPLAASLVGAPSRASSSAKGVAFRASADRGVSGERVASAERGPNPPHGGRPDDAPNESALLLAARSSLRAGSCAGALAKLDDMAARFPKGLFTQEREAMAIEALDCAGRGAEATERAARFLREHPASPYADVIRARR